MLNNFEIRDTIARDKWFDRTINVHSRHQQTTYKGDKQKVESDAYMSFSSTKTSGWSVLQISLDGSKEVRKYGSDLKKMIVMGSGNKINLFGNPNITTNRQQFDMPMKFADQCRVQKSR